MRVALTNDFELVVAGLARLLKPFAQQVKVVDEALRGAKVAEPVDLALFDTFGHPGSGLDEIKRLRADTNVARIAVFTWQLSERESEVLVLIAEGLSNAEIANTLYLSPNSVKTHIRNAYRKLEVTTRAQAVRAVLERHMTRRPVLTS